MASKKLLTLSKTDQSPFWFAGFCVFMAVCLLLNFAIEAGADSGLTNFHSQAAQTNSGADSESDNSPSSPDPDNDDVVLVVFATVILNSLAIALASLRVFVFTRHQSPLLQPPQTF